MNEDAWENWLLKGRFAGNPEYAKETLRYLHTFRESVLDNARLNGNEEFFLDVGSGDGLISFGALERMKENDNFSASVIFLDTSKSLLQHCREISSNIENPKPECVFIQGSAEFLPFKGGVLDVITTRSVLVYIQDKRSTIKEFHRTLKQKIGRISLFEPIFGYFDDESEEDLNRYFKCDVSEIEDIATRIRKELHS
jgi:arsenite methyltransferase